MVNQLSMSEDLSITFAALADPAWLAILICLAWSKATVSALAEPVAISGPAFSKHLKVLERPRQILRRGQAQRRPCRLKAAPFKAAAHWLEEYRRFREESFDQLDEYVQELQAGNKPASRMKEKKNGANK